MVPWDDSMFEAFRAESIFGNLPRCPECNSLIRAHVLWFDESYHDHDSYGLDLVRNAVCGDPEPTLMVFIGTSFAVTITDMLVGSAVESAIPMIVIDPHMEKPPIEEMDLIRAKSEEFLPALVEAL